MAPNLYNYKMISMRFKGQVQRIYHVADIYNKSLSISEYSGELQLPKTKVAVEQQFKKFAIEVLSVGQNELDVYIHNESSVVLFNSVYAALQELSDFNECCEAFFDFSNVYTFKETTEEFERLKNYHKKMLDQLEAIEPDLRQFLTYYEDGKKETE